MIPPVSFATVTPHASTVAMGSPAPVDALAPARPEEPGLISARDAMKLLQTRSHEVKVAWTVPAGSHLTAAALTPSHVAIGLANGSVLLVDRHTGDSRELTCIRAEVRWLASDDQGTIFIGDDNSHTRAMKPDGTPLWTDSDRLSSSAPLVRPDGTLVFTGGRLLKCVNAATGQELWSKAAWMWLDGGTPTPMKDGGMLVLTSNGLEALDRDGNSRWSRGGNPTPPAVGPDGTVYIGEGWPATRLVALDPATGKPRWEEDVQAKILTRPLVGPDGAVYLALSGGHAAAYSPEGKQRWKVPLYTDVTSMLAHDGVDSLLVANRAIHQMWALDATTGERAWEHRTALPHVAVMPGDERFYVADAGNVTALEDNGWRHPFRAPEATHNVPDDPTVTREADFVVIDGVRIPVRRF